MGRILKAVLLAWPAWWLANVGAAQWVAVQAALEQVRIP
jgi:hypothetical protein